MNNVNYTINYKVGDRLCGWNKVENKVFSHTREAWTQTRDKVFIQVWTQTGNNVRIQVCNQLMTQIKDVKL
jgi:hypothetical protein